MKAVLAAVVALGLALLACSNAPIAATPLPGEPCGALWHACGDGACCANTDVCGGGSFSTCSASSCCYEGGGDGEMGARRLRVSAKRWPGGAP